MGCDGERRKQNIGYGVISDRYHYIGPGQWNYFMYESQLVVTEPPLHLRIYRRKCDKPPTKWVLAKIKDMQNQIDRLRPASAASNDQFITVAACKELIEKMKPRRWGIRK